MQLRDRYAPVTAAPVTAAPVGTSRFSDSVIPPSIAPEPSSLVVQGGSLRTWSYRTASFEQLQIVLTTEGLPLDADIELWHGPDNAPFKMR
eukprot:5999000-Prymnesium_polylepis.1